MSFLVQFDQSLLQIFGGCESEDDHVSSEQGGVEPPVVEGIDSTNNEGRAEVNLTSTPAGHEGLV